MKALTRALALGALLTALLPGAAQSLEPRPQVLEGHGYRTWMAPEGAKAWRLERLLFELRQEEDSLRLKAVRSLGFKQERIGRSLMWRRWSEPIQVEEKWLGFERRTLAVLWVPYEAKQRFAMVVFIREGSDERFWKPWQLFEFDSDPAQGIQVSYPDVLSDDIALLSVRHMVKDDAFGNRQVVTLFKNDERGGERQLLPVWQETDEYYRAGKYEGEPQWMSQSLKLGDQRILRSVTVKHYDYTKRAEEVRYLEAPYDKPKQVERFEERFSWNPLDFTFYDSVTELEKLVRHKSPEVRAQAARRLGFMLSTSHPQLEQALLKDKDAKVRIQAALALKAIGDPSALASVKKAEANTDEDDTVQEAVGQALEVLESAAAVQPSPEPTPAAKAEAKPKTKALHGLPPIQAVSEPKVHEKK